MAKTAYDPSSVRCFALAGHRSCGKTSLGDLLLYTAGVTRSIGAAAQGTSLLDHETIERRRGLSLLSAFAWLPWEGHLLNLADTPGSEGLASERLQVIAQVDAVLAVVSAPDGVEVGAERVLREATRMGVPRMVVLNKMDRPADLPAALTRLEAITGVRALPVQLPFYDDEGRFSGVIPLDDPRVLRYDLEGSGAYSPEPLPDRVRQAAAAAWEAVVEAVALTDDELLERYLEDLELPVHLVRSGLARAVSRGRLLPVAFTSAALAIGAQPLLDLVAWALPSPLQRQPPRAVDEDGAPVDLAAHGGFVAQHLASRIDAEGRPYHLVRVWSGQPPGRGGWLDPATGRRVRVSRLYQVRGPRRATARYAGPGAVLATWGELPGRPGTTWTDGAGVRVRVPANPPAMLAWRLAPCTASDADRLEDALAFLLSLDAGLSLGRDEVDGAPVLEGAGREQLERAVELLRERLGVQVRHRLPAVPYREAPLDLAIDVRGEHRRTADGLVVAFGACVLELRPRPPGEGVRFEADAPTDNLPPRFLPAIEDGVRRAFQEGPLAGFPVVGALVRCVDGEYDILESTEEHFELAGEEAARAALQQVGTRLLEPWWSVGVTVPADALGVVLSEIAGHRGRILGLEMDESEARVRAELPYRELRGFGPRLQGLTAGLGWFEGRQVRWEPLPTSLAREVLAEHAHRSGAANPPLARSRAL